MNIKLKIGDKIIVYEHPIVMGIINCTPDSFYKNSRKQLKDEILSTVKNQIDEGADIIDLGGFSTRPNAEFITEKEELSRIELPIHWIKEMFPDQLLSIDTFRATVASYALQNGVQIINDISASSFEPGIVDIVAEFNCPYIFMHLDGTLETMHKNIEQKENIENEVLQYFQDKIAYFHSKGIEQLIIDPGFGFSKTTKDNFRLLHNLSFLKQLNLPILVGLSRKRMIWKTLDVNPENALNGTTVLNTMALLNGANILRVHDVKEAREAVKLYESYKNSIISK